MSEITVVDRPVKGDSTRHSNSFAARLRAAYLERKALSVPVVGESSSKVRSRVGVSANVVAKRMNLAYRTKLVGDAIVVWLEAKDA